jgi:hypothetical protein
MLLPVPVGVPQVSLFDDLAGSEDAGSEGDSGCDEALDLDPLRAYLAGLALHRRHAQVTTLTSLAAFKAASGQQRRPAGGEDPDGESDEESSSSSGGGGSGGGGGSCSSSGDDGDGGDSSAASSGASSPRAAAPPHVNGAAAAAPQKPPARSTAAGDAAAVAQLLTAFLQDCGLSGRLQVSARPEAAGAGGYDAASPSIAAVARSITLRQPAGSVEVRWTPQPQP